jgi:heterodisulfide reductase subunit A2
MANANAAPPKHNSTEPKVGVYVCHCGGNISDQVDMDAVCAHLTKVPGVVTAKSNLFMCSDPGQEMIIEDLKTGAVDRIVVASCDPSLHEATFRSAVARAGANPYLYEHANIREQVSWVHHGPAATQKAIRLIAAATAKAKQLQPLDPIRVEAIKHATVVGGGVAGLKAARDLAERGIPVTLLEKAPFLGGRTAQLDRLAPTGEKAADLIAALAQEVLAHERITVHTCARITAYEGYIGNFKVGVRSEPPAGPGELIPSGAVYPGGVPETAADFSLDTGAIILATGFRPYRPRRGEYGFGDFPEVITLPELIRLLAAETPRSAYLELNGRRIKSVALIHCVGSRMIPGIHAEDEAGRLNEYCSRTCCTATLHAANLIRQTYPDTNVSQFYRDIRTYGRGQEELYLEASKHNVTFFRFRPDEQPVVERNSGGGGYPLLVRVKDLLTFGEELEVPADLVVLAVGMEPNDISELVELMKLPVGEDRFLQEVHPKLRPVELAVAGILLAGTCQAPMDVGEACAAASAAAVKAAAVLTRGYVELDPFVAEVDLTRCRGAGECVAACLRAGALSLTEMTVDGQPTPRAQVNPALCLGCGACVAVCPHGAIQVKGWTLSQYEAMVDAIVSDDILD